MVWHNADLIVFLVHNVVAAPPKHARGVGGGGVNCYIQYRSRPIIDI